MTAFIVITLVGLLTGLAVALVVKYFGVPADPLQESLMQSLPGANCGGCGFPGCAGYAQALASGKAKPGACPVMAPAALQAICALLGVEQPGREPKVAVVFCSGGDDVAARRAFYNGVNNCRDAMLVAAGAKACSFGCLGLGACANACPFGAIEITGHHLAQVHQEICVGCGKCVQACPKGLIRIVPKAAPIHVFCSSPEKGAVKRNVCKGACIGCRKCQKEAGEERIRMNGNLAVINYGNYPEAPVAAVCPTRALRPN